MHSGGARVTIPDGGGKATVSLSVLGLLGFLVLVSGALGGHSYAQELLLEESRTTWDAGDELELAV